MKNKISFMDTAYARENGLDQGVRSALRYLIDNRQVLLPSSDLQTIYATKLYSTSPTNIIFSHIQQDNLLNEYALIDSTLSNQSTPELFIIRDITTDMKQLPNASVVLATLREYRDKIVINIAPLLQRSRDGVVRLNDVNELHNQIVRGALVSSYFNSTGDMWLNPNLLKYICQTYSMCISSILQRYYQLDLPSQIAISTALSWFYMLRMTDDAEALVCQCDYLGSRMQIRQTLDRFKETIDDTTQFDLHRLCDLIAICGPDHMKGFNRDILIRSMNRSGSSAIAMTMALEYPPYWVHQILYALSGNKVYLNILLQRNKLLKSAGQFLQDLDTSRQFILSIRSVTSGTSSYKEYSVKKGGLVITNGRIPCVLETLSTEEPTKKQIESLEKVANHNHDTLDTPALRSVLEKHGGMNIDDDPFLSRYVTLKSARISRDGTIFYQWMYRDDNLHCEIVEVSSDTGTRSWLNIPNTDQYLDVFGEHTPYIADMKIPQNTTNTHTTSLFSEYENQ